MGGKKTKIIEFDQETIYLVNKYGDLLGINTFSGVIRKMVDNELDRIGLNEEKRKVNKDNIGVNNQLSEDDAEILNEINQLINTYSTYQKEREKLHNTINRELKKESNQDIGKTLFENILLCFKPDKVVDVLYKITKLLFLVEGSKVIRVDEKINKLKQSLIKWNLDSSLLSNKNIDKEISVDDAIKLVRAYQYMEKDEFYHEKQVSDFQKGYNDIVEKYYEYKHGNKSAYEMIRLLSVYL